MNPTTPRQEAQSLREHPLPPEEVTDVPKPLHLLHFIDFEIEELTRRLKEKKGQRENVLENILARNINVEDDLELKERTRTERFFDLDDLKLHFPREYDSMVNILKQKAAEDMNNIGTFIPLGLCDEIIGEKKMAKIVKTSTTSTFSVIKRKEVKP